MDRAATRYWKERLRTIFFGSSFWQGDVLLSVCLKPKSISGALAAILCTIGVAAAWWPFGASRLQMVEAMPMLPADGRFHRVALLVLTKNRPLNPEDLAVSGLQPRVSRMNRETAELEVRSPVQPGERLIRVTYGRRTSTLRVLFAPSLSDSIGNGTPDFLRLHTAEDRNAFRGWFTALADVAADLPPEKLPREIDDCAALLRWSYRNALHAHDEGWLGSAPASLNLTQPSVRQYAYPLTPLGAGLFRVREGAFTDADVRDGTFAQFADARTLWRLNTFFLSRRVQGAKPGDLLFFRQLEQNSAYHSMILTGSREKAVVYHTGPIGRGPGEMRRVLLQDLISHPDPRWRPIPENSNFLGVYRWNILQEDPR